LYWILFLIACSNPSKHSQYKGAEKEIDKKQIMSDSNFTLTEEEWLQKLGEESYRVLRLKGTERPFTGEFDKHWQEGEYVCKGCGNKLFSSETKFDAGCGWPSFYDVLDKSKVILKKDNSHFMVRTEVLCAKCEGHLGHVFDDGPNPTGQRYCINSVSIDFEKPSDKK